MIKILSSQGKFNEAVIDAADYKHDPQRDWHQSKDLSAKVSRVKQAYMGKSDAINTGPAESAHILYSSSPAHNIERAFSEWESSQGLLKENKASWFEHRRCLAISQEGDTSKIWFPKRLSKYWGAVAALWVITAVKRQCLGACWGEQGKINEGSIPEVHWGYQCKAEGLISSSERGCR
jgi:hypothetical protein